MRRFVLCFSASATLIVTLGAAACGVGSDCDFGMCDGPRVGEASDGKTPDDAGGDAAPTDECLDKPDAPECLDEAKAFFVSPSGDNTTGDGSKAKPFKTLAAVLDKISEAKRRIYLCDGDYPEDVRLEAKHAGVSVFGGFTCDWNVSPHKPKLGASALALKIAGATGIALADLAVAAKPASAPGESSIAAFIANSEVTFKRVTLAASNGNPGDDGTLAPFDFPTPAELQGKNGDAPGNGAETTVRCPADPVGTVSSKGGKGGESGVPGDPGTPGQENGGSTSVCSGPGSVNTDGASGPPRAPAKGASDVGALDANSWVPRAGEHGAHGVAGQGGGGGYGSGGGSARGGGGGAGGCGGAGGGGGFGGGASIAVASFQSNLRFEASSLTSANAGKGGDGVAGQPGQAPGGTRGSGSGTSCNGGNGGGGGAGGTGGGGAGGISVGVLYKGPEPNLDSTTSGSISVGEKGDPGTGPGNAGVDGVAAPTLKLD